LRKREKQHLSQSRGNRRDLEFYRRGLEDLTKRLDDIDRLKYEHYETVAEHTRQVWSNILKRTTVAARAQVDILEKISDKGLQNDCLGRMIASAGDPFDIVPLSIIDQITPVEVVPRYPRSGPHDDDSSLTPVDIDVSKPDPNKPAITKATNHYGESDIETEQFISAPTAPTPPLRDSDPFDVVDDVPSVHSEDEGPDHTAPDTNTFRSQTDDDLTAPTISPPNISTEPALDEFGEFHLEQGQLLSKLGGYGWRG
jgi:hypothetical protein